MIIVSDTSPILNLAVIGQLHLLQKLYGKVVVPQAVYTEIVIAGAGQIGAKEVAQAEWVESILLIDERKGRIVANRLGVNSIGLLGILIKAKHEGLISAVGLIIDELRAKAGFWIGDDLYNHILQVAGER